MGAEGAVNILFRKEISSAEDPEAELQKYIDTYTETFANPYVAAGYGYLDDVISPENTRPMIIHALENLLNKRQQNPPKKHGNIPL
jgi:propionyl-CoA carboxylase beta subunit